MPFPCSASSSPEIASLPVTASALQLSGPGALGGGSSSGLSSPSFDHVLSDVDDSDSASSKSDERSYSASDATASPDQLASMAALMMPPSAPGTPPPAEKSNAEADGAPSLTLVGADGRTVPEMLARGAQALEYNVAAKSAGGSIAGVVPGTTGMPIPAGGGGPDSVSNQALQAAADAATSPAALGASGSTDSQSEKDAATQLAQSNANAAALGADVQSASKLQANATAAGGGQPVSPLRNSLKTRAGDPLEKTAGSSAPEGRSRGNPSNLRGKNVALAVDSKEVAASGENVGTGAANWGKTMYQDMRNFAGAAVQADPQVGPSAGISSGTTSDVAAQTSAPASHAGELVHEIHEIADGLWAVERNSVEVKFNFGQQDKLSVRVEYRDGTVSTTFRTDSADLRDAIAHQWQSQTASDQRPYRMADPVFTPSAGSSGFSTGGDASRQQRSAEQSAPAERFFTGSAPRSGGSMTSPSVVSPTSRPETAGRLHAIA